MNPLVSQADESKSYDPSAEDLRRSEELLNLFVGAVKDYGIFLLDEKGNILTWNEGAQRIKGYKADEIIGKHFSTFYTEEAKAIDHPATELKLALHTGHYEEEGWRVRKDGTTFWASVTITPVYNSDGSVRGFIKVTRDLTERRRAELELKRARDEALEASRLKSQFVANISHEVRTPLAGVIGMAEVLLLEEGLNEDQREAAEHIYNASKRLLDVLNDVLDFSKLDAGRMELQMENFNLDKLMREIFDSIKPGADKKNLSVEIDIDPSLPKTMSGDEFKLRQMLLNLAHNAVKFTAAGEIKLIAKADSASTNGTQRIIFKVTDTGIGIKDEDKPRLFEPFVQADGSIRRKYAGSGLGLSIVKGFAKMMGGEIGLDSTPGQGSAFWFIVPLQVGSQS